MRKKDESTKGTFCVIKISFSLAPGIGTAIVKGKLRQYMFKITIQRLEKGVKHIQS